MITNKELIKVESILKENDSLKAELVAWNEIAIRGQLISINVAGCKQRIKDLLKKES